MKYDVVIIGAGLGGLTAGAKLAKEGKKVLLIIKTTSMPAQFFITVFEPARSLHIAVLVPAGGKEQTLSANHKTAAKNSAYPTLS